MARYPLGEEPRALAIKTPHPLDSSIKFEEVTHTYFVNYYNDDPGLPNEFASEGHTSASGFIHQYFEDFDADLVIKKMRNGRKWNSSNRYFNLSDAEIKELWEINRVKCSSEGTWLHGQLEKDMNGDLVENSPCSHLAPIQQFLKWKRDYFSPEFEPFRTELRMRAGIDLKLTGTADLIAVRKNHPPPEKCDGVLTLNIIDWKFSKQIHFTNFFANRSTGVGYGRGICGDLVDTNFTHYCLQQSLYKYLLVNFFGNWVWKGMVYTSVRVDLMKLAVFHENHSPDGLIVDVRDLGGHIERMVEERRKDVSSQETLHPTPV